MTVRGRSGSQPGNKWITLGRSPLRLHHHVNPALRLVQGFALLIAAGTGLLALPWASATGRSVGLVDALFTATSAVCVTGLVVLDTATEYSRFGQAIILVLIQLGGLGIVLATSVVMVVLGKRILLRDRIMLQEAMGRHAVAGVVRLAREIVLVTLTIEAIGAAVLLVPLAADYPLPRALWLAVFHSVSAFNNAGFDLFSVSLRHYATNPAVVLTVAVLVLLGGIGFPVINEFLQPLYVWWQARRNPPAPAEETYSDVPHFGRRWRLSLHARVVLMTSGGLLAAGMLLLALLEWNNPATFGALPGPARLLASFYSAVTPRTAGFEVVRTGAFYPGTLMLTALLMFIGASPGGTGGGIKTSSFAAMFLTVRAAVRGRENAEAFGRRLPPEIVRRAWVIAAIAGGAVFAVSTLLMITERGQEPIRIFFETVSAFATVGLSTGLTPLLTVSGKLLITMMMFMGRVGPLTLAVALAERRQPGVVDFPEERVMIG